jgi:hypothetical protein
VFACTEEGIREAIAVGGGPHSFACDGPTTVVTKAEIIIDNDVILDGGGDLTVNANGTHRVFRVASQTTAGLLGMTVSGGATTGFGAGILNVGTLTLANSTVSGNVADRGGGGIENDGVLTVTDGTVSGNAADEGGGIYNDSFGTLTLTNSTVSGNAADLRGGGIYAGNFSTLTVRGSTVSGNEADDGGGIFNGGTLTMTNSTVSENMADGGGGGIHNLIALTLTSSTVSGNVASLADGILSDPGATILEVTNTLVDGDCLAFTLTSGGGNLESPANTCGFDQVSDQVGVSPMDLKLQPLADNGGPTETHALAPDSVAIDQITETDCVDADGESLATDQRGYPRPGGSMCDVGSFEVQP